MLKPESLEMTHRYDFAIIVGLTLPFLLNDFSNIYVRDFRVWLAIDYLFVKAVPLVALAWLVRARIISLADLGLKRIPVRTFILWSVAMTVLGTLADQYGSRLFFALLPETNLGGIPPITDFWLNQLDLYFGLMAVAIVEELVSRGLYFTILQRHMKSLTGVFVTSSLLFGLGHWSLGVSAIVHTSFVGALFMVCMWKTKSILPTIVAHFWVNYLFFSGIL